MSRSITEYVDEGRSRKSKIARGQEWDAPGARLKKRLVRTPEARSRVRLALTRVLMPRSRLRAKALTSRGLLRLNLGAHLDRKPGFYNVDLAGIPVDLAWDLTRPLPFPMSSVDAICHDHTLEHLPLNAGLGLTRECFRVLRPGGRLRISVPDAGAAIGDYTAGKAQDAPTALLELQRLFYEWGHRTMYDSETLALLLSECGFESIEPCAFGESRIEPCPDVSFRPGSLYIEAMKPLRRGEADPSVGTPNAQVRGGGP